MKRKSISTSNMFEHPPLSEKWQ